MTLRGKEKNSIKNLKAAVNITNRCFGRLTAVEKTDRRSESGSVVWRCTCDCGKVAFVSAHDLLRGNTTSCGCKLIDSARNAAEHIGRIEGTAVAALRSKKNFKSNTSGYRGVSYYKKSSKWRAYITFKGHQYSLGLHETPLLAAKARKEAESRIYGEFLDWYYAKHDKEKL